jgi:hypothetical protein
MSDIETPASADAAPKKGEGTPVRLRLPPKLLGRLDAYIDRQPDPKPTRGRAIKMLVRVGLNAALPR